MVVPLSGLYYHIININLHVLPDLVGEYVVHESLVSGTNIREVEGHAIVVVVFVTRREGDFWGV